jgi:hypothetical protein
LWEYRLSNDKLPGVMVGDPGVALKMLSEHSFKLNQNAAQPEWAEYPISCPDKVVQK